MSAASHFLFDPVFVPASLFVALAIQQLAGAPETALAEE
jgi:hypothetical protein